MPFEKIHLTQINQKTSERPNDIHTSELFGESLTPEQEQDVSAGVPPLFFPEEVKPTDWKKKLEGLKGLTPEVNPPELKLLIQQPVDIKTNF